MDEDNDDKINKNIDNVIWVVFKIVNPLQQRTVNDQKYFHKINFP